VSKKTLKSFLYIYDLAV